MNRLRWVLLAGALACSGCAGASQHGSTRPEDDPSGELRLRETLKIAEQGPTKWPPVLTLPLHPVLLVVDTTIKFTVATAAYLQALLGIKPSPIPVPETVERAAESLPKR